MRLGAGGSVLIHSPTGGVGLVAVEYAHRVGATVLGSVGRPSKVLHARDLGVGLPARVTWARSPWALRLECAAVVCTACARL